MRSFPAPDLEMESMSDYYEPPPVGVKVVVA